MKTVKPHHPVAHPKRETPSQRPDRKAPRRGRAPVEGDDRVSVKPVFPYPVKRRIACENRLIRVMFEDFDHNQQRLRNYIVVEPRHANPIKVGGVAVLPIWNGKVGLLKMFRHALAEESWEIPRGFLDPNEEPVFSALRELYEETGLTCEPKAVIPLGYLTPDPGIIRARIALFVAPHCHKVGTFSKEEAGHLALKYTPVKQVHRMMVTSRIQDPCSLVSWFRWRAHPSSKAHPV